MSSSTGYFRSLSDFDSFAGIADTERYRPLPDDWIVVVADVEGSTKAIQLGRYKEVNMLGVSVITGVQNAVGDIEIPFVFGGDGASLCIPPERSDEVRRALIACRQMARDVYGLVLRIGLVPVADIHATEHQVLVARFRASEHYTQAAFTGGGMEYADRCIKEPELNHKYLVPADEFVGQGDFSGLECRWEAIPSPRGESVSLLVRAMSPNAEARSATYSSVISEIARIYGAEEENRPLNVDAMQLTLEGGNLRHESGVRSWAGGWFARCVYWFSIRIQVLIGRFIMKFGVRAGGVDWGRYKEVLVANSDFRKFDDMLRQILSGTPLMREELVALLEAKRERRELVYGVHVSDSALMTCMIGDYESKHIHFVDGNDGGYARAAVQLKRQLKEF